MTTHTLSHFTGASRVTACYRLNQEQCLLYLQTFEGNTIQVVYNIPEYIKVKLIIELIPPIEHLQEKQSIKFHCCYLLQSIRMSRRIYFGYSVNPFRRIRQHNCEIKGGAKKTKYAKPWRLICYITGFYTEVEGLQFEWRLHHPITKRRCLKGSIKVIAETASLKKWVPKAPLSKERPLTIWWKQPGLKLPFTSDNIKEMFLV